MRIQDLFYGKWRNRIVFAMICIILIITVVFGLFYSESIRVISSSYILDSNNRILDFVKDDVDSGYEQLEALSNSVLLNDKIQTILKKNPASYGLKEQLEDHNYLISVLEQIGSKSDFIKSAYIMVNPEFYYANEMVNIFPMEGKMHDKDIEEIFNMQGGFFLFPETEHKHSLFNEDEEVLTIARALVDLEDFSRFIGILYFDISVNAVREVLQQGNYNNNDMYLVLGDSLFISSTIGEPVYTIEALDSMLEYSNLDPSARDYNIQTRDLKFPDAELISILNLSELIESITKSKQRGVVTLVSMFVVAVVFSYFISRRLMKRIYDVEDSINESYRREFSKIDIREHDEISFFEYYYNDLVDKINYLLDARFQQGQELQETRYQALKSQINPHFLYNAFNTINMLAMKSNSPEISQMVRNLTAFYRLSLNQGQDEISVADEVKLCNAYMEVQRIRFSFPLNLKTEFDDEKLEDENVINIIMQPLIENAILHGILGKNKASGEILISGRYVEDGFDLFVEDNGCGCDIDVLDARLQEARDKDASGYGLYNVNQRIRLKFGPSSGLSFENSERLGGLKVKLHFQTKNNGLDLSEVN